LRLLCDRDTLKITRLGRLGRSVLHLVTLGAELRERGVGLHVIERGVDTSSAEGRAMFGMLSVLAELQRELIVANTRDGLATARARGANVGRDWCQIDLVGLPSALPLGEEGNKSPARWGADRGRSRAARRRGPDPSRCAASGTLTPEALDYLSGPARWARCRIR
jgi:hypothetical protein